MGNSLLDVIVFGRNAGKHAAEKAKATSQTGELTLGHIYDYEAEMKKAGVVIDCVSPKLLPTYTHGSKRNIESR